MTIEEFSTEFDTTISSYRTKIGTGNPSAVDEISFDEYEKSVFLTDAQEEIVLGIYTGKNGLGESFENTEETRRYLSNLVKEATREMITTSDGMPLGMESATSRFFTLPEDLWFITYESLNIASNKCGAAGTLDVYPVTQDEYSKIKRNPFRGASDRRALRLDLSDGVVEIISKYAISNYYIRYVRKIKPIILVNLPNGLTINGQSEVSAYGNPDNPQGCELHELLHKRILERAVQLALQSRGYGASTEKK